MASVGAGLQAYTRFRHVEYANGDEMTPEVFLREVEGAVLESMLREIFDLQSSGVVGVDHLTRFYVLWRFTYGVAEIDAGEAYVFCYPQSIELDESSGLVGPLPTLVEKRGSNVYVRTYSERGANEELGLSKDGRPAPLIDMLHRILWLIENRPDELQNYIRLAGPNLEQLRLVAQALSGPVLTARPTAEHGLAEELSALHKLTANWRTVVDEHGTSRRPSRQPDRQAVMPLFGETTT